MLSMMVSTTRADHTPRLFLKVSAIGGNNRTLPPDLPKSSLMPFCGFVSVFGWVSFQIVSMSLWEPFKVILVPLSCAIAFPCRFRPSVSLFSVLPDTCLYSYMPLRLSSAVFLSPHRLLSRQYLEPPTRATPCTFQKNASGGECPCLGIVSPNQYRHLLTFVSLSRVPCKRHS